MGAAAAVKVLGGLGLFLLGIHHLTEGLKSLAGDALRRALQTLVSGRFSAVVSGALFTVASQSSTATILTVIGFVSAGLVTFSQAIGITIGATLGTTSTPWLVAVFGFRLRIASAATTLVALDAGSLTYQQACAMVVGQSIGTAATSGLAALGGGLAVRRTALAHVTFSVVVGVLATLFLGSLTAAAEWVGVRLHDPDGVLALAAFSSLFKLAGILVFYPWLDHFVRLIERISGSGGDSAVSRLDPTVARAGGAVALEAAW